MLKMIVKIYLIMKNCWKKISTTKKIKKRKTMKKKV